jgi:excisionase family DNA binding protein
MEFLTIQEAATQLKVHENTVKNFIARGQLVAFKIGRTVRIQQAEIDRISRGQK